MPVCRSNDCDDCSLVVVDVDEQHGCDFGLAAAVAVAAGDGDDVVAIWGTKIVVLVC